MFRKKLDRYALTSTQHAQLMLGKMIGVKPTVVVLYDEGGGVTACHHALCALESHGFNIIKIPSSVGFDHPIFKTPEKISGIYLPGGPNVLLSGPNISVKDSKDNDTRVLFEHRLIEFAKKHRIPGLGVCRGLQMLAFHEKAKIINIQEDDENRDPGSIEIHFSDSDFAETKEEIKNQAVNPRLSGAVVVPPGNALFDALQHKFNAYGKNKGQGHEYEIVCGHYQCVTDLPPYITVLAYKKSDNSVEAISLSMGSYQFIGIQHHPELTMHLVAYFRDEQLQKHRSLLAADSQDPMSLDFQYIYSRKAVLAVNNKLLKAEAAAEATFDMFARQVKHKYFNPMVARMPEVALPAATVTMPASFARLTYTGILKGILTGGHAPQAAITASAATPSLEPVRSVMRQIGSGAIAMNRMFSPPALPFQTPSLVHEKSQSFKVD